MSRFSTIRLAMLVAVAVSCTTNPLLHKAAQAQVGSTQQMDAQLNMAKRYIEQIDALCVALLCCYGRLRCAAVINGISVFIWV